MGLDISVYKVKSIGNKNPKDISDFYTLKDRPELKIFKKFIFEKENSYYNLEKAATKKGFILKNLEYIGTEFSSKVKYQFLNNKHPLYKTYKWLETVWSKTYFENIDDFKNSEYYKEFKKKHLKLMIKNGWKEKYNFFASGNNTHYFNLVPAQNYCTKLIKVFLINPPKDKRIEKCISFEEVGYQRKGANSLFYEKGMWDSPCVLDKKTLMLHWKEYFSKSTPESKGGFGSQVEYKLANKEMKKNFKENIINKFIEGETFVVYH